jgi:hypothetical protein
LKLLRTKFKLREGAKKEKMYFYSYSDGAYIAATGFDAENRQDYHLAEVCDYINNAGQGCSRSQVIDINTKTNLISRIDGINQFPEFRYGSVFFIDGSKHDYVGNGCQQNRMFRQLDITGDGEEEVLVIGGYGRYGGREGGVSIRNKLSIYKPTAKQIIYRELLSYEEYFPDPSNKRDHEYLYSTGAITNDSGEMVRQKAGVGFKEFYKHFLLTEIDSNKRETKRLFVWGKRFESRKKSKQGADFSLVKDTYSEYHFDPKSNVFVSATLESLDAKQIIEEQKLVWIDGYPNYSICNEKNYGKRSLTLDMLLTTY